MTAVFQNVSCLPVFPWLLFFVFLLFFWTPCFFVCGVLLGTLFLICLINFSLPKAAWICPILLVPPYSAYSCSLSKFWINLEKTERLVPWETWLMLKNILPSWEDRWGNVPYRCWEKYINEVINNLLPIISMTCPFYFHYHDNLPPVMSSWSLTRDRRGGLW